MFGVVKELQPGRPCRKGDYCKVCSVHFEKKMFAGPFQSNRLKKTAVPTMFSQIVHSSKEPTSAAGEAITDSGSLPATPSSSPEVFITAQQSLLIQELQSSSDSLELTEDEFLPTTCLTPSPRSATQTADAEENDLQHFIKLCAKFLPQSLMQFVKEQALLHKRKTKDSRVRGQKRKNDSPEQQSFHMSKTRYVKDIGDNGAENCENLATEEIAIVEGNLIQLESVLDDYNFDEHLDVKEEELLIEIKTEPVDENDAPTLEDPLAITTSPNSLAENQYKKKDLQTPTLRNRKKTNTAKLTKSVFDQVWRKPSAVSLPSPAWACQLIQSSTKNVISIAKMGLANDTPIVERSIVLNETSVQVFVANKRVRSSVLEPSSITSVVELQSFVRAVDSLREVCGEVVVRGGA